MDPYSKMSLYAVIREHVRVLLLAIQGYALVITSAMKIATPDRTTRNTVIMLPDYSDYNCSTV